MARLTLLEAAKTALETAESWIHDQLDGTPMVDKLLAELQDVRDAIAEAEGPPKEPRAPMTDEEFEERVISSVLDKAQDHYGPVNLKVVAQSIQLVLWTMGAVTAIGAAHPDKKEPT
jgi:hypothetical protein